MPALVKGEDYRYFCYDFHNKRESLSTLAP